MLNGVKVLAELAHGKQFMVEAVDVATGDSRIGTDNLTIPELDKETDAALGAVKTQLLSAPSAPVTGRPAWFLQALIEAHQLVIQSTAHLQGARRMFELLAAADATCTQQASDNLYAFAFADWLQALIKCIEDTILVETDLIFCAAGQRSNPVN